MKKLIIAGSLLALTATLSACGGGGGSGGGNTFDASTLSGTLSGWTYGNITPDLYGYSTQKFTLMTGSTIASDGKVNVRFPDKPASTFDLLSGCNFSGTRTTVTAGVELADVTVWTPNDELIGELTQVRTSDNHPLTRLYSDTAGQFVGTATCGPLTMTLDLNLRSGWNAVTLDSGTSSITIKSIDANTPVALKFIPAAAALGMVFTDTSGLNLTAGQPVSREVTLYQQGGISGTVNLSTDVQGVTVSPSTLTLTPIQVQSGVASAQMRLLSTVKSQYLKTTLTFGLDETAVNYSGGMNLTARQSTTVVGTASFAYVSVQAPVVMVGISAPISGYRSETSNIPMTLQPQNGFSGPVTLNFTGLPAGVTIAPVTVNVTANATTTLSVPVQLASNAALGQFKVQVNGLHVTPTSADLMVKPARTLLTGQPQSQDAIAAANSGVWLAFSRYDMATSKQITTFQRYVGGQKVAEAQASDVNGGMLTAPNGDVYFFGPYATTTSGAPLYRLKDDGSYTQVSSSVPFSAASSAVDAQGRIWYMGGVGQSIGVINTAIFVWNPATGQSTRLDPNQTYTNSYGGKVVYSSNNGRYLVFIPNNAAPVKVDTQTNTTTSLTAAGTSVSSVAVSDAGQVWYATYSTISRVNDDGSVTSFNLPSGTAMFGGLIGFDRVNSTALWVKDYYSLKTMSTADGTVINSYPTDMVGGAVMLSGGGVAFVNTYMGSTGQYALSTLP